MGEVIDIVRYGLAILAGTGVVCYGVASWLPKNQYRKQHLNIQMLNCGLVMCLAMLSMLVWS